MKDGGHISVLTNEVLTALQIEPNDVVVDATLGGAGHFEAILARLNSDGLLIGIDADSTAVARAREVYARDRRADRPTAHLITDNFRNFSRILERLNIGTVDKAVFDLGWSAFQIESLRGFSFSGEGSQPLLMTYGDGGETAAEIINSRSEAELADIIFSYGEERYARTIAHAIVQARKVKRILTTEELLSAVLAGTPPSYHKRKIHPATKTFQAFRIAVNDELGAIRDGLSAVLKSLSAGGRVAVITFHSIEDRVVKTVLRDAERAGLGSLNPKKAIIASRAEVLSNRRARCAKLRVFERAAKLSSEASFTQALALSSARRSLPAKLERAETALIHFSYAT